MDVNDLSERISNLSPEDKLLLKVQLGKKRGVPEPIAIVGIGCRFPGAENVQKFWQLLLDGQDAIREIPADRWNLAEFYHDDPALPGKHYCRQGGFLDQVDQFDPEFFGITPREAAYIDPQQRLMLEVLWAALEDAALPPDQLNGTKTGVFVGASTLDYGQLLLQQPEAIAPYTTTGLASTMLANRISYLLNFQGPSLTVDTACSSSLVAVHLACQSLRQGESTVALAGGVNLMLTPALTIGFSKLTALSAAGRCKAFDAAADGFVRSEGAGVVVLKPLSRAVADGDRIYALIRGGAINQDGRTNGLTAPNREAQEQVLRDAYRQARVPLARVSYIEAHGTGTLLGDPIEAKALGNVFSPTHRPERPIRVGSVKSNIGHTEAAAGIASLIKVALALKHKQLVPSLHFHTPNPYIPFDQLPIQVQAEQHDWHDWSEQTIAGVSSFGFGGSNAHMVLQAPPVLTPTVAAADQSHLLTLSATSGAALRALAKAYLPVLQKVPDQELGAVCHTANTGRTHFNYRLAVSGQGQEHLYNALSAFIESRPNPSLQTALPVTGEAPGVVWLFTGQGSQYPRMGWDLYQTQPVFRAALHRCDDILRSYLDLPLLQVLYPESPQDQRLHQTVYTQPALFALEYALAELWQSWGLRPAAVMGHSVGEYVAACVAAVFSLEDGLKLIAQRGKLMQSLPNTGAMAAILTDPETVAEVIKPYGEELAIATLNGPKNTVIAGLQGTVKTVLQQFKEQGIAVNPLTVSHAFHSPLMDPILNVFEHAARQISCQPARIPLVTNLTGDFLPPSGVLDASYWRRHARQPVRFAEGIRTLNQQGYTHFLEIGPHPVLSAMGRRCLKGIDGTWLPSLRRGQDPWQTLTQSLGTLYCQGREINWSGLYPPGTGPKISLPTYPFQRQRHWIDLPGRRPSPGQPVGAAVGAAYAITWLPRHGANPNPQREAQTWLVVCDRDPLWQSLSRALRQRGISPIRVTWGPTFAQIHPHHFQVNPDQEHPFHPLLADLFGGAGSTVGEILYLAPTPSALASIPPVLLALIQALADPTLAHPPRLWLLTTRAQTVFPMDDRVDPGATCLWGLGRTLRLEHPEFWGGLIDLPQWPTDDRFKTAAALGESVVTHILTADGEDEVALRQHRRWVARLQPLDLASHSSQTGMADIPIHPDATYLITGGTGGLGQQIVPWLVGKGARHLVLLSRRGPNARLETWLAPLRQQGATIWVEAVDVADADAVARLLDRVQQHLPPLKGILHGAGVLADGFLIHQTPEQFQRVMAAKLQGAWNLHQLTQSLDLDWFVLFSSIASQLGSPGQGNYSAANAGLDGLAWQRWQQGLPTLSISWGPWQEAGMAVDHQPTPDAWSQRGMASLPVSEGVSWLALLLGMLPQQSAPHIGVAGVDWQRLQHYLPVSPPVLETVVVESSPAPAGGPAQTTPDQEHGDASAFDLPSLLTLPEPDRVRALQAYFQAQVAQVTGLQETIPLDRPLLDLGLDSLMIMDLLAQCKQDLQLVLYPREVMAHPTVTALANYVARELVRVHQPQTLLIQTAEAKGGDGAQDGKISLTLPHHPWQPDAFPLLEGDKPNPRMVFLLSAPRSGSTLLRVMLAGHRDLFCPPELHLLPFNTLESQQKALGSSYLQEGLQRALMELLQLDADQSRTLLEKWVQHQLTVPEVYNKLQQTAAPRLLVDKSPTYGFSLDTLKRAEQMFAGAQYIHLVRHPYGVIDSFVRNRMHKIFDITTADSYDLAEQVWYTSNHNISRFLEGIEPARQFRLRYEDLVADPETLMEQLCNFLGLAFDPAVLTPYQGSRMTDGVRAQSLAVDDPNFRQRDRIDPALAQVWQSIQLPQRLSPAGQTLAQSFDYPLPREAPTRQRNLASEALEAAPTPSTYRPFAHLREEQITVGGRDTAVCHWGPEDGPRVLCLHGILEQGAAWDGVADPLLQQGCHIIAPDLRGHGHSAHAGPDGGYQLVDFLGDMDSFTQGLNADSQPLVLVGHSMGAVLSAVLASLRPDRFRHLVLVEPVVPAADQPDATAQQLTAHLDYLKTPPSPVIFPTLEAAVQRMRALKPELPPQAAEKLTQRLIRSVDGGFCWRWDPRLQARTTLSLGGGLINRQGYGQLLNNIALPTTVILGNGSQFNRAEDLSFLIQHLPRAQRLTLSGGHDLPSETPGELAHIIQTLI